MSHANLALFRKYSLSEIHEISILGGHEYSESYLLAIRSGNHKLNDLFRMRMAKAFDEPEAVLFTVVDSDEEVPT